MDVWIGVVGIVIGVILSEGIRWLRDRREGREKYRVMLYEKRLGIHQDGFRLVRKLSGALPSRTSMTESRTRDADEAKCELEEWWAANCLYLDHESKQKIVDAIVFAEDLVNGMPRNTPPEAWDENQRASWFKEHKEFRKCIHDTLIGLQTGIGMKHVEEPRTRQQDDNS